MSEIKKEHDGKVIGHALGVRERRITDGKGLPSGSPVGHWSEPSAFNNHFSDKLHAMEHITLRQRHKLETIEFMLKSKLDYHFNDQSFNCFIKELFEEIKR